MKVFQFVFFLAVFAICQCQPGIIVRLNKPGLDAVRELIEDQTIGFTFPNIIFAEGSGLRRFANISNLTVTDFEIDPNVILTQPSNYTMKLLVQRSSLSFAGLYSIELSHSSISAFNEDSSGAFSYTFDDTSAEIDISIINRENSIAQLELSHCDVLEQGLSTNFRSNEEPNSNLYKTLKQMVNKTLRKRTEKSFCNFFNENFITFLNEILSSLSQGSGLIVVPGISINVSLYQPPFISSDEIYFGLDGRIYATDQSQSRMNFARTVMDNHKFSDRMLELSVSQYTLETYFEALVSNNVVNIALPLSAIPSFGNIAINEDIFNSLIENFPDCREGRPLVLRLALSQTPTINLQEDSFSIQGSVDLHINAIGFEGNENLATVLLSFSINASMSTEGSQLMMVITDLSFDLDLTSPCGDPTPIFQFMKIYLANSASSFLPTINGMLANVLNVPIPPIGGYIIDGLIINVVENAVQLAANISEA